MKLEFHGAARSVTGSMHIIESQGYRLLLECGLFQGHREESERINRRLPFSSRDIHGVILSHAHIDHSGNLPNLVKSGFRGKIFATSATVDLATLMLQDSARIQAGDAEYLNKKFPDRNPVQPLYGPKDAEQAIRSFKPVAYHQWFSLNDSIRARFLDAGHILGSGIVEIEAREEEKLHRIVFTGDLGRRGMPILRDPEALPACDILIAESTYGDRVHPQGDNVGEQFVRIVQECVDECGRLIIPAFSVGRTQSIIYELARGIRSGKIPQVPVFVDSPLSTATTQVLEHHPEVYDQEMRQVVAEHGSPLFFRGVRYVESVEESKSLNKHKNPIIIISASGMCESGRVLHHLKNAIDNPCNRILLVGYQAMNTLGRRLKDGMKRVRILGEEFDVRAKVMSFDGFSAHADREGLLAAMRPLTSSVKAVFLVHGEEEAADSLAAALRQEGMRRVEVPERGSVYSF